MTVRDSILRMRFHDGLTYREIAAHLGVSRGFVAGHLYRERKGTAPLQPSSLTTDRVDIELAANGNNRTAAARTLGVSRRTIDRYTTTPARGPHGPIRATDPATLEVCQMIERSGMSDAQIAERAGIGVRTISSWRSGRSGRPQFLEWVREAIS